MNDDGGLGPLVSATRHDHHNLEIKLVSEVGESPLEVQTDLYLFVPHSFEIKAAQAEVMADIRSRIRLSAGPHLRKTWFEIVAPLEALDFNLPPEQIQDVIVSTCSVFTDAVKAAAPSIGREFLISQALSSPSELRVKGMEDLKHKLHATYDGVCHFRDVLHRFSKLAPELVQMSDEYLSQLFVGFLHTISEEFDMVAKNVDMEGSLQRDCSEIIQFLGEIRDREAKYRRERIKIAYEFETELDRERRLIRLSHLKKYFQSRNFVDVKKQMPIKRFQESTAFVATLTAGSVAAFVEQARGTMHGMSVQGYAVIITGILIYVFRDRMKDWARVFFAAKMSRMLPHFEQALTANGRQIGSISEWYNMCQPQDTPEDIRQARHSLCISPFEDQLPEDVVHCRKVQSYLGMDHEQNEKSGPRALHEIIRINLERHLRFMDDPVKELTEIDASGKFRLCNSHRVYHFYLIVRTMTKVAESTLHSDIKSYRLVLDKNGLVRVETNRLAIV